jgi:hypothetical protein
MKKALALLLVAGLFSCTENSRAKNFGGEAEITLPQGQKLINVTWKDNHLWYISRPMNASDTATTYTFHEKSSWGKWEGTFLIHESK